MEKKTFSVSLAKNPRIAITVLSGHFTGSNHHVNLHFDISAMKANVTMARDIARELSMPYLSSTHVDAIVCLDKTETIGAFLGNELLSAGVNQGNEIHVVSPISNVNNNLVFKDSMIEWVAGRNVILLVAMMISGRAVARAMECLDYYKSNVVGISALFMAQHENQPHKVNALYTSDDISGYKMFNPSQCEMCKAGQPLDAIVSTEGYTYIRGNN